MEPGYYRHRFKQSEDYSIDIDLLSGTTPIDTTGWTGASEIETIDGTPPLDSDNNPIAFTVGFPMSGTVRFTLPSSKTAQLRPVRYLYDAKLVDAGGNDAYYLDGDVIVRRSYTQ